MVVCKFFQQGTCRFGQSCRYDHIYGSKYSYHAPSAPEATPASPAVTDDQLVNQVHADLQSMLRGGQWLLSGYAPFKEKPTFPGLIDMSPEEARLFIYEARANNTLDQAVAFMNNMFQEAKHKYDILLTKNVNIIKVLRSLYNGENVADPFSNLPQVNSAFGNNNASSVFRSAVQPSQPSVFAQNNTPSVFGQNNAFAQQADPAKSIFAQASQNVFQNQNVNQSLSMFGTQNAPPQPSIFAQTAQPVPQSAQSIFAQATQNVFTQQPPQPPAQNLFNTQNAQNIATSIFASASQNTPFNTPQSGSIPTNAFQKAQISGGFTANLQQVADTGVYSRVEDILPEDLEAFNSEDFKMGFIPEMPPPLSLCF